jgi:hypothetical protein
MDAYKWRITEMESLHSQKESIHIYGIIKSLLVNTLKGALSKIRA